MARAIRGIRVGAPYRIAEAIMWPTMTAFTKLRWSGQENLGKHGQGAVVAVNHISSFDPLPVMLFMHEGGRPPRLLAKDSLWKVPVLRSLMTSTGQIPVSREADPSKALSAAIQNLASGEAIVVYPEGTITRDPAVWPMKGRTGALRLALEAGVPLVPVAQWGAQSVMPPYGKGFKLFPRKLIQVRAGEPLDIDDLRGRPLDRPLLEEGTNRLMDSITSILEELRGQEAPAERLDWAAEKARREQDTSGPTTKEEN